MDQEYYVPRTTPDRRTKPRPKEDINPRRVIERPEISGGFGPWKGKIAGYDMLSVLAFLFATLFIAVICSTGYLFWHIHKTDREDHARIIQVQERSNELAEEQNFINSLPFDRRPNLAMPESLRLKLQLQREERRYGNPAPETK